MVTTFSPPARPKKKQKPILPIALGAAAGLLLIGIIFVFSQLSGQKAWNAQLNDTVLKVAESVGTDKVTAEILADKAAAPEALASLTTAVTDQMTALSSARSELEASQAEAAKIKAESEAAAQSASDISSQLDSAKSDLTARTSELAQLKKKYNDDTVALNASIEELKAQIAVTSENEVVATPVDTTNAVEAAVDTNAVPVDTHSLAMVIPPGKSSLFKSVRYDDKKSGLIFLTLNDKTLTYSDVPRETYNSLCDAPIFDVYYRFKIMDVYVSQPKDRELIRSITK